MPLPPPQTELPDDVRLGSDPPRYDPVEAKRIADWLIETVTWHIDRGEHVRPIAVVYYLKSISAYLMPRGSALDEYGAPLDDDGYAVEEMGS